MLFPSRLLFVPSLTVCVLSGGVVADDAQSRALTAFGTLQSWYNRTSGIWDTVGWWNGANCMTTTADLAALDPTVMNTAIDVFNNTYYVAPAASNPHPGPEVKTASKRDFLPRANTAGNASQWLDSAYDDDGWWALAWIAAYDVTHESAYLELAEGIFSGLVCAAL